MRKLLLFLCDNIYRFNHNVEVHLNRKYCFAWITEVYCFIRFGCSPDDFFRYRFYTKSNHERNKFITYGRSKHIIAKHNNTSVNVLKCKLQFNQYFKTYIKREWIHLGSVNNEEFTSFLQKHKRVLIKPLQGGQGKGIFLLTIDSLSDTKSFLEHHQNYLAEELLIQHEDMSKLNPSSVNTIRVLTFKNQIIATALRSGSNGSIVDNLHANGICAHIDIDTGIVDAPCIDHTYKQFLHHPTTGIKMIGFQIPNWDLIKCTVTEAASMVPDIAYIGWDVAILENDIAIIEGNHDPGHDIVQMIAQTGLYHKIRDIENTII